MGGLSSDGFFLAMHSARGLAPALLNIDSMSPPGYPSAWLPPGRSRVRFTWQVIVAPPCHARSQLPVRRVNRHLPKTPLFIDSEYSPWEARHVDQACSRP
jgi:hypothetical protein